MGDAAEMQLYAIEKTGIEDPADAMSALISSYDKDRYDYEIYDIENEYEDTDIYGENYSIKFEIGDIVKLNSGSPLMTVKEINNDILICRWFDGNKLQCSKFDSREIYIEKNYQKDI